MSQNERLRDNTFVVSEWKDGALPFRVTIVDSIPRLETLLRGIWTMHTRNYEMVSFLEEHVRQHVAFLNVKIERAKAEEREAKARGHVGDRLRWAKARREIEADHARIPYPWRVTWRERQ